MHQALLGGALTTATVSRDCIRGAPVLDFSLVLCSTQLTAHFAEHLGFLRVSAGVLADTGMATH